jgi:hypothetical protein
MNQKTLLRRLKTLKHALSCRQRKVFWQEDRGLIGICKQIMNDLVINIRCASRKLKQYFPVIGQYSGLGYPATVNNWCWTHPAIYDDAQISLYLGVSSDYVLLLNVSKEIPSPQPSLSEINCIPKSGEKLWLQIPFMYTIHDSPYDFHRWTELAKNYDFSITCFQIIHGASIKFFSISRNTTLSKVLLSRNSSKSSLSLFVFFYPVFFPVINIIDYLSSVSSKVNTIMPTGYTMSLIKIRQ